MLRKIAIIIFELSNILISRLRRNNFQDFLMPDRNFDLSLRVYFDGDFYKLVDKDNKKFTHFFKAEKQGNMAYGKGLEYRLKDLSKSYFWI